MAEKYGKKVKELQVKEMRRVFSENKGFIFSNIGTMKATEIDILRKKMRKCGVRYIVIKNRLADIALKEVNINGFSDLLNRKEMFGIGVIKDDPVEVAKLMTGFSKENAGFKVADGYLEGRVLCQEKVKELSELPAKEQLIAMVVGTLNAPISNFVNVLSSVVRSVVYALNAVKEKKESESK